MNKQTAIILSFLTLTGSLCSCDGMSTRSYLGTMAGAEIGGTIGEAIGWMSTSRHSGPGKAMMGCIIGTVAGAAIGHSIATKSESNNNSRGSYDYDNYGGSYGQSGFDYQTSGGYDAPASSAPAMSRAGSSMLTIRNLTYQDEDGNGHFGRYETINVIYEVTNNSDTPAQVQLIVDDPTHPNDFAFSPMTTATIQPHQSIRYKAKAFCKSRPKSRTADIIVYANSVTHGNASDRIRIKVDY